MSSQSHLLSCARPFSLYSNNCAERLTRYASMLVVCRREAFAGARWNEWTAGSWLQVGAPGRLSLGFGLVLGVVAGFGDCS